MEKNKNEITLKDNHLDLISSFSNHMIEEHKYDSLYDDEGTNLFNGILYDDEGAMDEYREAMQALARCSNRLYGTKKSTRRSGKKNKFIKKKKKISTSLFDDLTDEAYVDFIMHEEKLIYYYRDLYDPYDVQMFNNVNELVNFLDEEGISIDKDELDNIMSRGVNHCCIDPIRKLQGELYLKSDRSYGDLRFECAESEDELTYIKH